MTVKCEGYIFWQLFLQRLWLYLGSDFRYLKMIRNALSVSANAPPDLFLLAKHKMPTWVGTTLLLYTILQLHIKLLIELLAIRIIGYQNYWLSELLAIRIRHSKIMNCAHVLLLLVRFKVLLFFDSALYNTNTISEKYTLKHQTEFSASSFDPQNKYICFWFGFSNVKGLMLIFVIFED